MNFKKYHVSKNLFDISTAVLGKYIAGDGAEATSPAQVALFKLNHSDYMGIYPETEYIFSYSGALTANTVALCWFDSSKNLISRTLKDVNGTEYFISGESPVNAQYLIVNFVGYDVESKFMLNTGSTPLPYEPYSSEVWHDITHYIHNTSTDTITTPAVLYPNDTTATVGLKGNTVQNGTPSPSSPVSVNGVGESETIGEHSGQYKIPILSGGTTTPVYLGEVETTRNIKKLVLTGEENWSRHTDTGTHVLAISGSDAAYLISGEVTCVCTHYPAQNNTSSYSQMGDKKICMRANSSNVWIRDTDYSTTTDFKTYLQQQYAAGTPVTVWYVLADPTTGIVNEPLRKIGDYADEVSGITIPTIAGANTISIGTTLQPSEVTATYKGWHSVQSVHERENGAWD